MSLAAGPFLVYAKPNGGSYAELGCVEKGFGLSDGHDYYTVNCDGSIGQTDYDYFYQKRLPIDLTFVLNNVVNDEFMKLYAQWSAHFSEPGTVDGLGIAASSRAFGIYLVPITGSTWRTGVTNFHWVFPAMCWTPGFKINWNFGSRPTSLAISFRSIRQNRTYNATTYNGFWYHSATAPT